MQIPLEWESNSCLPAVHANQFIVSNIGTEYYLLFGEAVPPAINDITSNSNAPPSKVAVKIVAQVSISPDSMAALVKALGENMARRTTGQLKPEIGINHATSA